MDWLDLLAVQGTLKSLLQHYSSKASILWHSAFNTVQLSHPYLTTGKTTALTRQIFVGKVRSLLLNMLSRLVITFLPRSKCLLISWLQSPSAVILEPQKIKSDTFHSFPTYFPWSDGTWCHILLSSFISVHILQMSNLRQRFGNVLKNIASKFWGQDPHAPNTISVIPFPQTQRSRSEAN